MTPASTLPKGLRHGSLIVALGGLVPFLVSTIMFLAYVKSEANPGQPWLAGQFPPGPASFTLDDIRGFSVDVATAFVTAQHIELVNVMNSGVLVLILGVVRTPALSEVVMVGAAVHRTLAGIERPAALIAAHDPPVALVGEAVTLVGLLLARSAVFARHSQ